MLKMMLRYMITATVTRIAARTHLFMRFRSLPGFDMPVSALLE